MNKQQLAARIWETANAMRSKIEANEYKDYILGFIFYRFLSDSQEQFLLRNGMTREEFPEELSEDNAANVKYLQDNIGYFLAYDHLYSTWLARGNDFNVGDVTDALSAFERNIGTNSKALFGDIFDTLQSGLTKLGESAVTRTKAIRQLLTLIKDIPMDGRQGYDVLGFIYEYLISSFAANAGKKAGEFYTPHEVSVLMSQIIAKHLEGRSQIQIYDPTSGSGSLLLNIGQAVARHMGDPDKIKYFAQELKHNTYNLTRMNLVMRGIKPDNIVTRNADSLEQDWPMFTEDDPVGSYHRVLVDAVVSNPPYSQHWESSGHEHDARYSRFDLAPDSKADYAFLLHDLFHVKPDGIMTIVLPNGVLFRGSSEATIRRELIEQNHIDTIIGLPSSIFFGTGIPTIIMVLKQKRDSNDVLFIDASQGFKKIGKNNQLRAADIRRIAAAVENRVDVERFARVVSRDEIRGNDYNLNLPRYVSATPPAEPVDLYATMFGGIPEEEIDGLSSYWEVLPGLREALFEPTQAGYAQIASDDVHGMLDKHPSVESFRVLTPLALTGLCDDLRKQLVQGRATVALMQTEDALTAEVFERFAQVPLIDSFDAYQILHDQWSVIETDLEVIRREGEGAIRQIDPVMVIKTVKKKKVEVQDGWQGRVLPFDLVQEQLLPDLRRKVDELTEQVAGVDDELAQLIEGLTEEDKVDLEPVMNEAGTAFAKGPLGKAVAALKKTRQTWSDDSPEGIQLSAKKMLDSKTGLDKNLKAAKAKLEEATHEAIKGATEDQIDELLVAKWIDPLIGELSTMPSTVLLRLEKQVRDLRAKYAVGLVDLDQQIQQTEVKLGGLLVSLTGSTSDVSGLKALQEILGGHRD